MHLLQLTKEKFQAYLQIQKSGITNMFDTIMVIGLSKAYAPDYQLTRDDILNIMQNYSAYEKEYDLTIKNVK